MSVQRNFLFNTILTVSNYLFPFIIYPYVARVLGVDGVGICNYVDSIIDYTVLFSSLGIGIIGIRQISAAQNNPRKLNRVFTSLFIICAFFTLIASAVLMILTFNVPKFFPYKPLLIIGLLKLWGNFLLVNWLYIGLEKFKFVTIRTIIVKFLYLISVFVFVRNATDYKTYYLLLCMMFAVNAVINITYAAKFIRFDFSLRDTVLLIGPILIMGVYKILNSLYLNFNVAYLGWECGDVQVGYYSLSAKLFQIVLEVYSAYSAVVMPRACALLAEGKTDEFKTLIRKSVSGLVMFAVPVVLFMIIFAGQIVAIFFGNQFGGSVLPMRILMPLVFIIGYNQILVVQILTALAKDKQMLIGSIVGASIGLTLNFLIVSHIGAVGSAIVWVCAETGVLLCAQFFVRNAIGLHFPLLVLLNNLLAYVPFALIGVAVVMFVKLPAVPVLAIGCVLFVVYVLNIQKFYLRNEVFTMVAEKITAKLPFLKKLGL